MPDHDTHNRDTLMFPRRRFLHGSALMAGGMTVAASPVRGLAAGVAPEHTREWLALLAQSTPVSIENYAPVALTETEIITLRAVVGRIIPTDDLGPGADEAGVHIFIDRSLKGPNAALLPVYQGGLAALAAAAGTDGFAALDSAAQDQILTQLEANTVAEAPEGFLALLIEHTRQGMFGDPIYGGNANFAGWDLIGYPGIKLVWTDAEQQLDTVVEPEHISVEQYGGKGW